MEIKTTLIDTNVLIYAMAGKEPFASFYRNIVEENKLVLSSIVVAEFLSKANAQESRSLQLLIDEFNVFPVDTQVAIQAAKYRKQFLKKKMRLPLPDCLIAATCFVNSVSLATFNIADYPMKDIEIVRL